MRTVVLPPNAEMLLNSMRAIGYSFETAIADIIDNSIAAGASRVSIETEQDTDRPLYLAIIDNGTGMNEECLLAALRHACVNPGARRNAGDLGRFGLGLKTASLSQCRVLTVISKQNGSLSAAEWNLDTVAQYSDWALTVYSLDELTKLPCVERLEEMESGTIVLWRDFDRFNSDKDLFDAMQTKLAEAKEHLSLVFHRFLDAENGSQISMDINGRKIKPKDPFLRHGKVMSTATPEEYISLSRDGKIGITVVGYTLPYQNKLNRSDIESLGINTRSVHDDQGFYIYRNKRLISWGSWLKMSRKAQDTKLSRVRVDVPNTMDHLWDLDIKKSKAQPPKVIRDRLGDLLGVLQQKSVQISTGKQLPIMTRTRKAESFWNTNVYEGNRYSVTVNRNSEIFKQLCDSMDDDQQKHLLAFVTMLEVSLPIRWINAQFSQDSSTYLSSDIDDDEREKLKNSMLELLNKCGNDEARKRLLKNWQIYAPSSDNPETINRILEELAVICNLTV